MSAWPAVALAAIVAAAAVPAARAQEHDHGAHAATAPSSASDDGSSEFEHAPPDPPATSLPPMSHREMTRMMTMDDDARFGRVTLDQLEARAADGGDEIAWKAWGWYGSDTDKAWLKGEGRRVAGTTRDARVEALWDHVAARWWSVQTGLRRDIGASGARDWLALGVQGLAPGFFVTEVTAYLRSDRVALRASVEYDLLLTQRLVLQPALDANLASRSDALRGQGAGLSDASLGLRLRYELRREFAPFVGVRWERRFGNTADLARSGAESARDVQALAGLRIWW